MKKLLVAGVAALVVGIAGGTAFRLVTKPDAPPVAHTPADSLHADSAQAADTAAVHGPVAASGAAGDSVHAGADSAHVPADSVRAGSDSTGAGANDAAHAQSTSGPRPVGDSAPRGGTGGATAQPPADTAAVRLSRIFGAMKPDEAARVLSQLEDQEVRAVLMHLTDRKAAAILSKFPGERAATLTRTILSDARGKH